MQKDISAAKGLLNEDVGKAISGWCNMTQTLWKHCGEGVEVNKKQMTYCFRLKWNWSTQNSNWNKTGRNFRHWIKKINGYVLTKKTLEIQDSSSNHSDCPKIWGNWFLGVNRSEVYISIFIFSQSKKVHFTHQHFGKLQKTLKSHLNWQSKESWMRSEYM